MSSCTGNGGRDRGRGRVVAASTAADWTEVRQLIGAYLDSLGFDIGFQGLDPELADPAGSYGPPTGAALLALDGEGRAAGFTGVRRFGKAVGDAELKRMYVAPEARGLGLGRALCEAAIAEARRLGHRRLLLDSRTSLVAACTLYRSLGFVDVEPYRHNPFDDAVFLVLDLG